MFFSKSALFAGALLAAPAFAHVEMTSPAPLRSKFNKATKENDKDYSMTNPLSATGSDYPCKGYNTAAYIAGQPSQATLNAGDSLSVSFDGSATHDGGSCQFSLSYDGGKTFGVIASIMGGCPLKTSYTIKIPEGVPSGNKALFAWTWQNKVGNREEYMNCAVVDVKGTASSIELPQVFRANTLKDGTCITTEGQDYMYPNPGEQVQFGGSLNANSPTTNLKPCSYDENATVTLTSNGGSVSSGGDGGDSGSSSGNATSAASPAATTSKKPKATGTKTTSSAAAPAATTSKSSSSGSGSGSGSSGSGSGSSGSGSSGSGSSSSGGSSGSIGGSTGSTSGAYIKCTSSTTWSLCDGTTGTCTPMGSTAAGMTCNQSSDASQGAMEAIAVGKRRLQAEKGERKMLGKKQRQRRMMRHVGRKAGHA